MGGHPLFNGVSEVVIQLPCSDFMKWWMRRELSSYCWQSILHLHCRTWQKPDLHWCIYLSTTRGMIHSQSESPQSLQSGGHDEDASTGASVHPFLTVPHWEFCFSWALDEFSPANGMKRMVIQRAFVGTKNQKFWKKTRLPAMRHGAENWLTM